MKQSKQKRWNHDPTQPFLLFLRILHKYAASNVEGGGAVLRQAGHSRLVGLIWATIGADYDSPKVVMQLQDAGIL